MKYLFLILLSLTGCATTGSKDCDRYQAIEDCQTERNEFFSTDMNSSEMDNYSYCEATVPQCPGE